MCNIITALLQRPHHATSRATSSMRHIAHVQHHHPCATTSMRHIVHIQHHHPCATSSMCNIVHVQQQQPHATPSPCNIIFYAQHHHPCAAPSTCNNIIHTQHRHSAVHPPQVNPFYVRPSLLSPRPTLPMVPPPLTPTASCLGSCRPPRHAKAQLQQRRLWRTRSGAGGGRQATDRSSCRSSNPSASNASDSVACGR